MRYPKLLALQIPVILYVLCFVLELEPIPLSLAFIPPATLFDIRIYTLAAGELSENLAV